MLVVVEQSLNGLQFGLLLFLLAAGLTLVFGIMDFVNLAHGSLYMMGAYFAATFVAWTGNFVLGIILALGATLLLGIALEFVALRHLYGRDHLDHVLATFGLILFFNDAVRLIWGPAGLALPVPAWLTVPIAILPGIYYPAYRLAIIVMALVLALMLYVGVMHTPPGLLGRAFLPDLLRQMLSSTAASTAAPALSSMLIYLLMAIVLVLRPEGLFPANRR